MPHYSSSKTTLSNSDWRSDRFLNDEPEDYKVTLANGDVISKTYYPYKSKWRKRKDRRRENAMNLRKGKTTPATEMMIKRNINPAKKAGKIHAPAEQKVVPQKRGISIYERRTLYAEAYFGPYVTKLNAHGEEITTHDLNRGWLKLGYGKGETFEEYLKRVNYPDLKTNA